MKAIFSAQYSFCTSLPLVSLPSSHSCGMDFELAVGLLSGSQC